MKTYNHPLMRSTMVVMLITIFAIVLVQRPNDVNAQEVIATIPLDPPPSDVWRIAVNPNTNTIFMSDPHGHNIRIINGITNTVTTTISLTDYTTGIGVNPGTNLVYVSVFDICPNGTVYIIDGESHSVIDSIQLTVPLGPNGVAVNTEMNKIYVANGWMGGGYMGRDVTVIDGTSNTIITTVRVGYMPYGIDINPVTNRLYVANNYSNSVSVIDGSTDTLIKNIYLGNALLVAVNFQTNRIYATDGSSPHIADRVTVIDGATNTVIDNIPIDPYGLAVNSLTNRVYISDSAGNLNVLDGADNSIVATLPLGGQPKQVGVNPYNGRVYVYNRYDGNAYVIQDITPALQVTIDIKPGSYPNAVNLGSYGLIPVAILSDEEFDATTVDPDTVELGGAGVAMRGKGSKLMAHEEDVNGDGLVDLVIKVATQNLDPDSFQDGYAVLSGETYNGVPIEGQDEIAIVPPEPEE